MRGATPLAVGDVLAIWRPDCRLVVMIEGESGSDVAANICYPHVRFWLSGHNYHPVAGTTGTYRHRYCRTAHLFHWSAVLIQPHQMVNVDSSASDVSESTARRVNGITRPPSGGIELDAIHDYLRGASESAGVRVELLSHESGVASEQQITVGIGGIAGGIHKRMLIGAICPSPHDFAVLVRGI